MCLPVPCCTDVVVVILDMMRSPIRGHQMYICNEARHVLVEVLLCRSDTNLISSPFHSALLPEVVLMMVTKWPIDVLPRYDHL